MQIEVGKVYKCGYTFVYIEYKSQTLSKWQQYDYIGIECNKNGTKSTNTIIGCFSSDGEYSVDNPNRLHYWLEDITKRETIKVGDSVFYKDEFEAATKNLKRVEG